MVCVYQVFAAANPSPFFARQCSDNAAKAIYWQQRDKKTREAYLHDFISSALRADLNVIPAAGFDRLHGVHMCNTLYPFSTAIGCFSYSAGTCHFAGRAVFCLSWIFSPIRATKEPFDKSVMTLCSSWSCSVTHGFRNVAEIRLLFPAEQGGEGKGRRGERGRQKTCFFFFFPKGLR